MYCRKCGKLIPDDSQFCQHCGTPIEKTGEDSAHHAAPAVRKRKNIKIVVAIIAAACCIVLAIVGIIAAINSGNTSDKSRKSAIAAENESDWSEVDSGDRMENTYPESFSLRGSLVFKNISARDCAVKIINQNRPEEYLLYYVSAQTKETLQIPMAESSITVYTGDEWQDKNEMFGTDGWEAESDFTVWPTATYNTCTVAFTGVLLQNQSDAGSTGSTGTESNSGSNDTQTKITSLYISGADSMTVSGTVQLELKITPSSASANDITWSSDNMDIATVDENGKVTAKTYGIVEITATDGNKKATHTIYINPPAQYAVNGFIKSPSGTCEAPVSIHAPNTNNCYVYFELKDGDDSSTAGDFSVYVSKGSTLEFDAPLGQYELYYATGDTWYGPEVRFGVQTSYYKCDSDCSFYVSGDYVYGTELTLYAVENGNMSTTEIDEDDFPG